MRKRLVNTSWHCSHPRAGAAGAAGELSQVTRFSKNGVSSNDLTPKCWTSTLGVS